MKLLGNLLLLAALAAPCAIAQTPAPASSTPAVNGFNEMTQAELQQRAAELMKQAQASPSGSASVTLQTYPGHHTMLTVRTKPGGAEQHEHAADMFIVLDGEATEMTGGTIENLKTASPGELRGSRVVGGTGHVMKTGDIIHIAPGTPHQTLVAPGKTFTYFVVKFDQ